MLTTIIAFFAGVLLAPVVKPLLRPLLVELIRAGLMTADEVRRISAEVQETVQDAAAEAQAQRESRARATAARESTETPPPPPV
jgi:TPP-dependent pyruvate/acetoin dehydrogenase alpha subunit